MKEPLTTLQELIEIAKEFLIRYSFQALGALIILLLGVLAARWTSRVLLALFEKRKMDVTLAKFLTATVRLTILVFAVIIALGKIGITITPFIAAMSAMAFGASLAVQGTLSNYGAGLSIILTRPFVIGDSIAVAGVSGVVKEIKLSCTVLIGGDGAHITVPNKQIDGEIICNLKTTKMAEGEVRIGYDSSPETAIQTIENVLAEFQQILKGSKPQAGIKDFGDSAVNIQYRYWTSTASYAETVFAVNLAIYRALQKANISIPFPQRDVRILSQPAPHR